MTPCAGHLAGQDTVHDGPSALMLGSYAPIFSWGPLLLVAVTGYWLRRRRQT